MDVQYLIKWETVTIKLLLNEQHKLNELVSPLRSVRINASERANENVYNPGTEFARLHRTNLSTCMRNNRHDVLLLASSR